jgi:hypothetical protein
MLAPPIALSNPGILKEIIIPQRNSNQRCRYGTMEDQDGSRGCFFVNQAIALLVDMNVCPLLNVKDPGARHLK